MLEEKIARINELYHKSQKEGLTPKEKEEQATLRQEYIAAIRNNIRSQLDNIDMVDENGKIVNLGERHANKGTNPKKM